MAPLRGQTQDNAREHKLVVNDGVAYIVHEQSGTVWYSTIAAGEMHGEQIAYMHTYEHTFLSQRAM